MGVRFSSGAHPYGLSVLDDDLFDRCSGQDVNTHLVQPFLQRFDGPAKPTFEVAEVFCLSLAA